MKKLDLTVRIGRLRLNTPVICASGTFDLDENLLALTKSTCIGAIVTKTITLTPRQGNRPPRIVERKCGIINSIGLENPGWEGFLKEKVPLVKKIQPEVIVSIAGEVPVEFKELARRLDTLPEVGGVELNLSCPNLGKQELISQSAGATYRVTKAVRGVTEKTLIVKLTPEVTDIREVARAAEKAGADAISLVNTFFALAIDVERRKFILGNIYGGYSGPAIKPLSLYRVWQVATTVKIPVIGGGGIFSPDDAIEFLLAGAKAVSIGTVNMINPKAAQEITEGIKKYMRRHNLTGIRQIKLVR